jgi:hypothetical protein
VLSWFSCFDLGIGNPVYFLIDTGATRSLLSEKDAKILAIDYSKLELQKEPIVGLGGTAPLYRIKSECKLTFLTSDSQPVVETLPNFDVTKVELKDEKTRNLVFNLIPSLIGMETLERFKLVATKDSAYLER